MKEQEGLLIELYAVRNQDGEFYRAKGYSGAGESWVPTIEKARVYTKIGPAKAAVTYFSSRHPKYGVPDIVRLVVTDLVVIDQTDRVKKTVAEKNRAKLVAKVNKKKREFERLQKEIEENQKALRRLGV